MIENRTSGGSIVGTASVTNAPADGYTLLVVDPSVTITPSLRQNPPYQLTQLKTSATITTAPLMVVVNPQLPIQSIPTYVTIYERGTKSIIRTPSSIRWLSTKFDENLRDSRGTANIFRFCGCGGIRAKERACIQRPLSKANEIDRELDA